MTKICCSFFSYIMFVQIEPTSSGQLSCTFAGDIARCTMQPSDRMAKSCVGKIWIEQMKEGVAFRRCEGLWSHIMDVLRLT